MISREKNNQIYIIFTYKRSILFKYKKNFWKFQEIADDHNSGTECARNMKFASKCVVLDTLLYSTNNSISTKSWLRPFGNELFISIVLIWLVTNVKKQIIFL